MVDRVQPQGRRPLRGGWFGKTSWRGFRADVQCQQENEVQIRVQVLGEKLVQMDINSSPIFTEHLTCAKDWRHNGEDRSDF